MFSIDIIAIGLIVAGLSLIGLGLFDYYMSRESRANAEHCQSMHRYGSWLFIGFIVFGLFHAASGGALYYATGQYSLFCLNCCGINNGLPDDQAPPYSEGEYWALQTFTTVGYGGSIPSLDVALSTDDNMSKYHVFASKWMVYGTLAWSIKFALLFATVPAAVFGIFESAHNRQLSKT